MKRRLLSLVMALVMLLSLVSGTAIAADEGEEQEAQTLYVYWCGDWGNGGSRGDQITGNSEGCLFGDLGENWYVLFYTDEDGTNMVSVDNQVTYVPDSGTAEDAVLVSLNDDNTWNIAYECTGSGVIQTTVDGVVYERATVSRLPQSGFFKEAERTEAGLVSDGGTFVYSDAVRTFYYIMDYSHLKVTNVVECAGLDYTVDADGKIVTFTIPDGADIYGECGIRFEILNIETNETWYPRYDINVVSCDPRVVGQSDYRDYGLFYENEDDTYDALTTLEIGYQTGRVFYIREGENVTLAQNYSVSSSDTSVMTVEKLGTATNTGNTVWNIVACGYGEADVVLTFDNGEVLTYPVEVVLPNRGFSTADTLTKDSYMVEREFFYTASSRTFYFVVTRDGETISEVTLEGNLANALDYTISEDGRSVAFTVKDSVTADWDGDIFFALTRNDSTGNYGYSFNVLNGAPMLVYRYVNGNRDNLWENVESSTHASVELSPNSSNWVSFHLREKGDLTALENVTGVVSANAEVAEVEYLGVSDLGNPVYEIIGRDFGATTITVTYGDDQTLTMPVNVVLPERGFSTADTLTEESYISNREFYYTETGRTFYYVIAQDNLTVDEVTLDGNLADALDYTLSDDNRVVTFTVKEGITEDLYGRIFFMLNHYGNTWGNGYGFNVINGASMLVYRYAYGDSENPQESVDDNTRSNMELSPNNRSWVIFYLREEGDLTALENVTGVVSANAEVAEVEYLGVSDLGNPVYEISGRDFGTTTIAVTYGDDQTLTMPVNVVLPERGFSTADTLTEESYISNQEFHYTETGRTFYYVIAQDNLTVDEVTLEGNLTDALDYTLSDDNRVVTFTVKEGVTEDLYGSIFFMLNHNGSTWGNGFGFDVMNGASMLVCRYVNGNQDNLWEDVESSTRASMEVTPNSSNWVSFYLREEGDLTALKNVTEVVSANTEVAEVEYLGVSDLGNPVYRIAGKNFGATTITVTYGNDQTLTMPVNVVLPERGFSTADTLTEESYISDWEFYYTETGRTFYYVIAQDNLTVDEVTLEGNLIDALDYTLSDDNRVVTFTVKDGVTEDLYGSILFTLNRNGNTYSNRYGFRILNGAPRMVYRWVNGNDNYMTEELESNTQSAVNLGRSYSHWVVFCMRSGDTVTALQNVTSVVSSNSAVVTVEYLGITEQGNPAYRIRGVGFGEAEITVTYDGGKTLTMPVNVTLPDAGWSSAQTLTEESFVDEEFIFTTTNPTIYYVVTDSNLTITSAALDDWCAEYADCFDIALGDDGSYVAITVKDATGLGGRWFNFAVQGIWNGGNSWKDYPGIQFTNGDASKLGTPSELEWNVEYDWDGTKGDRMGSVGFKRATLDQARYEIEYYRVGESTRLAGGCWGWGSNETAEYFDIPDFIYEDLPSGEYYFRIRAYGDGNNYRNGDWVTSDTWTYEAPQERLTAPTVLYWTNVDDRITMNWGGVADAGYYDVEIYYAETENGEKKSVGRSFEIYWGSTSDWLNDWIISEHGDGWYFFRVRAVSADITQIRNSEWSAFSDGFYLGDIIAAVNKALENIDSTTSSFEDVQQAVSVIDNLDEALAADTDDSGAVAVIEQMEADLGLSTSVDTTAAPAGFDATEIKVTGAALNIDTSNTSTTEANLTITAVDENNAPPTLIETQYKNSIQFEMDIPEAKDTDASTPGLQLAVPVKITLPVPGNINPAFLVVLHCKEDANGEKTWEELSWPHVYQDETGKWFATFVVDSMSPFALVERQSKAVVEDGAIMLDAYLPTTGGEVEFMCAVYSSQGQMLKLVTLESHANEPVAIEMDEIQEGMYLKLLSINVGDGWVPVSDAQEVAVATQES